MGSFIYHIIDIELLADSQRNTSHPSGLTDLVKPRLFSSFLLKLAVAGKGLSFAPSSLSLFL